MLCTFYSTYNNTIYTYYILYSLQKYYMYILYLSYSPSSLSPLRSDMYIYLIFYRQRFGQRWYFQIIVNSYKSSYMIMVDTSYSVYEPCPKNKVFNVPAPKGNVFRKSVHHFFQTKSLPPHKVSWFLFDKSWNGTADRQFHQKNILIVNCQILEHHIWQKNHFYNPSQRDNNEGIDGKDIHLPSLK